MFLLLLGLPIAMWWLWPAPDVQLDRGRNGLWMSRHGMHGTATTSLPQLVERLRARGITRIYPFVGPPDGFGHPGWRAKHRHHRVDTTTAQAFLKRLHRLAPDIQVLPWTGGVHQEQIHFEDARQRDGLFAHIQSWMDAGAAGVHLNIEPLPDRGRFIMWLKALRQAVPTARISIAAFAPPWGVRGASPVNWPLDDYDRLCAHVDEIVVMGYDTGLPFGRLYAAVVAGWVRDLSVTLADGPCRWSMGVPTYEDDVPWHDPDAETLAHALAGIRRGMTAPPANFDGVTLYAAWTTDPTEWHQFDTIWRRRPPAGAGPRLKQ